VWERGGEEEKEEMTKEDPSDMPSLFSTGREREREARKNAKGRGKRKYGGGLEAKGRKF
jgi:hypothetical protein